MSGFLSGVTRTARGVRAVSSAVSGGVHAVAMASLIMSRQAVKRDMDLAALFPDMAHTMRLYRAALADDFDLAFLQRTDAADRTWRAKRNRAVVAVIVDTVGQPAGPSTWQSAVPIVAWAEIAVLHQVGAEDGHYRHAAELAKTHLRVLLIEAPAEVFEDWLELLQRRAELAVEVTQ